MGQWFVSGNLTSFIDAFTIKSGQVQRFTNIGKNPYLLEQKNHFFNENQSNQLLGPFKPLWITYAMLRLLLLNKNPYRVVKAEKCATDTNMENMLETHRLSQTKYSLLPVKQDVVCLDISTHIHAFIKYTIGFYNSTWTYHSDLSILNLLNTLNLLLKEFP